MRVQTKSVVVGLGVVLALAVACGGEKIHVGDGKAASELKGRVLIAPVVGSTVTAYKADLKLVRGAVLATGTTNETGDFELSLPPYQGHVLLVATSGTYSEPSIGLGVQLGTTELAMLVPDFTTGSKPSGLRLTLASTLAVEFARWHVNAKGEQPSAAYSEALVHLHQHFGGVDWATITPADLTVDGVTNLSPEAKAGLVLAGFSWLSKTQAETSNVQPGLVLNAASLITALAADSSDGTLDGKQGAAALSQGQVALSGLTARNELVSAMSQFVNSARNKSALRLADISTFIAAIGTNADPYLFCLGQVATESCGSGPVDTEAPVLSFIRPIDGAGIAGSAIVDVQATDNAKLRTLRFTAPAALVGATPVWTNNERAGVLSATLDVSALPDGPLELRAEVTDVAGNAAAKSISVIVNNHGPLITVDAPSDGSTVSGVVALQATAIAQAGSIASLTLVSPPPGVGNDSLPAAGQYGAVWTSTQAPEGLTTLTFHAEDTLGGASDFTVRVNVDNTPFGVVTTTATLGAPVGGLSVKLFAIDNATGLPNGARVGGALLGETASGSTTDPNTGAVTFNLSQENYEGPVQLVAQGTTATYLDPTDDTDATTISLPTSFTLTSYVAHYKTGDSLQVPLTGWTTLADDAALAYALGKNPSSTSVGTLTTALSVVEPLFPAHVSRPTRWPLRTVFPVSLTGGTQSMRDVVFAALPDIGLNQLARDTAVDVGLTPGTGYGLPQLLTSLRQDISDGLFDGKTGTVQLSTGGATPYALDANTSRFKLAVGMDRFIRSAANTTGLARPDLQTSGIYDNVSGDTSILYPNTVAPIPFDNVAPVITWTVKYSNGAQVSVVPFVLGTTKLVAGVVSIEASSVDSSGVQNVTVDVGGQPLTPGMGSTNALFKASFDTRSVADGSFTFTAQSCDRLANCGSSTFVVDSDNTVPTVSPVKPLPGFYSSAFDVEALASDNSRLETFTVAAPAGAEGLADQDAQLNRVYAPATSWTLGGGDAGVVADGAFPIVFSACDVVGNCASSTSSPTIDRTPPTVAFAIAPPLFTNQGSVTITISATDSGAGLSRVFIGRSGLPQPIQAAQGAGVWSAVVPLQGNNVNTITIWAEDLATPANSGQNRSGFNQTVTVFLDNVAPSPSLTNFAAYYSEAGLNFQKQAGVPVMPVAYLYQSSTKADLSVAAVNIVKAASRLSWGPSTPTAAELEGANSRNVPFFQFQVPYTVGSDSPLSSFEFRFNDSNSGVTAWAAAIPAARTGTNVRFYDVPITIETLPALVSWGGAARSFTLELRVLDQAGNSGGGFYSKTFQVVPPPVSIVRDTAYENRGDAKSVFNYRVANQSYDEFFDVNNANFATDAAIRHTRYVVYNPAESPVAVSLRNAPSNVSGRTTETWTWTYYAVAGAPGTSYQTPDGYTFRVDPYWDTRVGSQVTTYCGVNPILEPPCGYGTKGTHYPAHIIGSGAAYTCLPIPLPNELTVSPPLYGAAGVFRAFRNAVTAQTGVESVAADTVSTGFVVPGASGGVVGTLAVYHASPRVPSPRGSAPNGLIWQPNPYDAASKYQYWQGEHWVPAGDGYGCGWQPERITEMYAARRRYQQLVNSVTTFNSVGAVISTSGVTSAPPYSLVGGFVDYETQTSSINFQH